MRLFPNQSTHQEWTKLIWTSLFTYIFKVIWTVLRAIKDFGSFQIKIWPSVALLILFVVLLLNRSPNFSLAAGVQTLVWQSVVVQSLAGNF
jgi:hypothetical protein